MLDCLKNIVGVVKDPTPVITAGLTAGQIAALQVSTSGLFLDELPGGVHMKALKYSDVTKQFSDMALGALDLAAKNLEDDLILALRDKYDKSRKNFQGQIGQLSYATSLPVSRRYQYLRIKPVDYIDGIIKITRINFIFNGSGSFNLHVLQVPEGSVMGTVIKTIPVNITANQFKTVEFIGADVLQLPLIKDGQPVEHWFYYDTQEMPGALPKDMKISCGTCGVKSAVNDYVEITGGEFNDLSTLHIKTADNYTHGMVLDALVSCNTGSIFCREYNNEEAVAVVMAYSVWYKAGELLIEEVLKSPDVNRYTTQAREYLWGKRNHFVSLYGQRLKYLASIIDVQSSNCYVCRQSENQPTKGKIYS